jgi:hypothetical protein
VVAVGFLGSLTESPETAIRPSPRLVASPAPNPSDIPEASEPPARLALAPPLPRLGLRQITDPPAGRILTFGDGYRWLDLTSGNLGPKLRTTVPIRRLEDGSYLCACLDSPWSSTNQITTLRIERFTEDGADLGPTNEVTYEGVRTTVSRNVVSVAPVFTPDGSAVLAGAAMRVPDGSWRFDLGAVPVAGGDLRQVALGTAPAEPEIRTVPPPSVSLTPDGRWVMVSTWIYRGTIRDPLPIERRRWLVPFDGVEFGKPREFDTMTRVPGDETCSVEGFVTDEVYAEVCFPAAAAGPSTPVVRRLDVDHAVLSSRAIDPAPEISANFLIDERVGAIFGWDPDGHRIYRMQGDDGSATTNVVPLGDRRRAGATEPPDRHFLLGSAQTFVLSPDRSLIYALGAAGGGINRAPGSTGIWVFEADTLLLRDHWEPAANYSALGISADGRELYASGMPGVTASGQASRQEVSVTIHDTTTGEFRATAGRLGRNFPITFVED